MQLMTGVVSNWRSLWATGNPVTGELAASVDSAQRPSRPRGRGASPGLQAAPYQFLYIPGLLAIAGSSGPGSSSGRDADLGRWRSSPCYVEANGVWVPLTCPLHIFPVIPCIFLWGVSFAGIFYAPGMHVPSVY